MSEQPPQDLTRLAALGGELPWRVFSAVADAREPLTRQQVADLVGIPLRLASFHLDRLLDAGILTASYARPEGVGGPGAGRPAKRYRPADEELAVSVPGRRYDLAAEILLDALQDESGLPPDEAAIAAAERRGRNLGSEISAAGSPVEEVGTPEDEAEDAGHGEDVDGLLTELGYQPYRTGWGATAFANCPFHRLSQSRPDIVCTLNHAFLTALLDTLDVDEVEPVLACSRPGDCCVTLERLEETGAE